MLGDNRYKWIPADIDDTHMDYKYLAVPNLNPKHFTFNKGFKPEAGLRENIVKLLNYKLINMRQEAS